MKNDKVFYTVFTLDQFDNIDIVEANKKFNNLKERNVIINNSFDDNIWNFYDEYSYKSISFDIDNVKYVNNYHKVLDIHIIDFINYMKVYVIMEVGELALSTLQNIINDIKRFITIPIKELDSIRENIFYSPYHLYDFISLLPIDSAIGDDLLEILDIIGDSYRMSDKDNGQRQLATFDTYFLFNDIINDYWKSVDIDDYDKIFYYPLYLWWKITGIIPLRPREFILTPKECLVKKSNNWYIRLRRNNLKGSGKHHSYKIAEDYFICEYQIPEQLAQEVLEYIDLTNNKGFSNLDTLFIPDVHYKKWEHSKSHRNRYFTYVNLCTVLRYFYKEVIIGKYKLKVVEVPVEGHLEEGTINRIHLGDTRHLALINIIAEGGTPVIAMVLAGHDQINTAAHYYSNITTLIECKTYAQYRKMIKGNVMYAISKPLSKEYITTKYIKLDGQGRCYSKAFLNGDYSDCVKAIGEKGEIGHCLICPYYRRNSTYFNEDKSYQDNIKKDCEFLAKIIREVRKSNGHLEDILQACLKLHNSTYNYQKYLEEREKNNAKEKENR